MRARCGSVISNSEKRRASGFHFAGDETRFVVSHGCLRHILAGYAGLEPGELDFMISEFGKPSLRTGGSIHFNMAHSGEAALVAVSGDREIGVDIECVRNPDDFLQTARRCFSPRELDLLRSVEESQYADMFYTFWTRKEAYIKARGEGMSLDLTAIDVTGSPAVLDGRWHIRDLGMYSGCKCALAADGPIARVRIVGTGELQTDDENAAVPGTGRGSRQRVTGAVR
jgi:4'-phosphopantetheinyl transferase